MSSGPEAMQAIVTGTILIVILGAVIAVGGALHDSILYTLTTTLSFREPYLSMVQSVLGVAAWFYPVCIIGIVITVAWVGKVVLFDAGYTGVSEYDEYRFR